MAYKSDSPELIAIIGSACRFASGITSPKELWDQGMAGSDLSQPIPNSRFSGSNFFHVDSEHHGTTNSIKGYFLNGDHRHFDASFFNITPQEAEAIDPQHRLLLEVVYEALESAGIPMQKIAGQAVGMFAGTMTSDYETLTGRDELNTSQYVATGTARSLLANRVSYTFDFRGPSMTIDTACSSSLVALHQAVQSLRSGESSIACVAGVNMILTPEQFMAESSLHMLSPTGHCRMWDTKADGYARGEGITAFFIKPLSSALADGDNIQAIIRETGVSSDGRTQGITRPSCQAQTALICQTYLKAGLDPKNPRDHPQFFEAHGTGTPVGDPVEARAIDEAFFCDKAGKKQGFAEKKMLVGSIKTIIGHTEGAAGLAGVLKVVQSMKKGSIIPNLHHDSLSPQVLPFCDQLRVVVGATLWPTPPSGHPCRGSVNSFGFGGTNSHAIIEKYEPDIHDTLAHMQQSSRLHTARPSSGTPHVVLPLVVSAASSWSLQKRWVSFNDILARQQNTKDSYQSAILAWQLFNHQTTHAFRKVLIPGFEKATTSQNMFSTGGSTDMIRPCQLNGNLPPKILGIFTGQGAQYAKMSKELFQMNSVYSDTIKALDKVLQACSDPPTWTIQEELMKDKESSRINTASFSQVTCCALQIGLVDFLRSIGIAFACVVGHSSGEIAAAYAAGRISQHDAILISYYRGKFAYLAGGTDNVEGGMAACGMSKEQAERFCLQYNGKISVAASNSSTSVTLSGDLNVLEDAIQALTEEGLFVRRLKVDKAYHSFHMTRAVEAYSRVLEQCITQESLSKDGSQWVSTVSGKTMIIGGTIETRYWGDNMQQPVLFQEAVETAVKAWGPFDCVVEVGPHPALQAPIKEIYSGLEQKPLLYTSILDRNKEDRFAVAGFLGFMWAHFGPSSVNIGSYIRSSTHPEIAQSRVPVPKYAWDHNQIHWRESRLSTQYHFRSHPPHELLGVRTRDDDKFTMRWRNVLKIQDLPWLTGHRFQGETLLPASAYCVMAFDAAEVVMSAHAQGPAIIELLDVELLSGIIIELGSLGVEILFSLAVSTEAGSINGEAGDLFTADFTLTSIPLKSFGNNGSAMVKNFQGKMRVEYLGGNAVMPKRASGPRAETMPVKVDAFYQMMDGLGLNYTGPFRALKSLDRRLNYAAATLGSNHPSDTTALSTSPALLDGCFQTAFATFSSPGDQALWTAFLPTNIAKMCLYKSNCSLEKQVDSTSEISVETYLTDFQPYTQSSTARITADLSIYRPNGQVWLEVEGLKVASFAPTTDDDDYELYLHTVMDIDPEDETVSAIPYDGSLSLEVTESCERVAQHYSNRVQLAMALNTPPESPTTSSALGRDFIQSDCALPKQESKQDEMRQFIQSSRISSTLDLIRETCETAPLTVPRVLDLAVQEAQLLLHFKTHLGRVVQQIAHRYPKMNILALTDPRFGFTQPIMDGLRTSFRWYTIGQGVENNLDLSNSKARNRISTQFLDLDFPGAATIAKTGRYDMIVLCTSLLKKTQDPCQVLKELRKMTKGGAFLVVIDASATQTAPKAQTPSTPPSWMEWLDQSNFQYFPEKADQMFPLGFTLHVRQAMSSFTKMMMEWSERDPQQVVAKDLLMIGGGGLYSRMISEAVEQKLSQRCGSISRANTLEDVTSSQATNCTAIILLADLDKPVATNLDHVQLAVLKQVMRSGMICLWVTRSATHDAERAASLGLARTLKAEIPNLTLQVLNNRDQTYSLKVILQAFCHLAFSADPSNRKEDQLWSVEGEVHIKNNKRLIPRIMPYEPANARFNAYRRLVTRTVDSGRNAIEIRGLPNGDGSSRDVSTSIQLMPEAREPQSPDYNIHIRVDLSSSWAVQLGRPNSVAMYACVGRDVKTGNLTVGLSNYQASIVRVQEAYARDLSPLVTNVKVLTATLSKVLFAISLLSKHPKARDFVLVNPDNTIAGYMKHLGATEPFSLQGNKLHFWTTDLDQANENRDFTYVNPWTSNRELKRMLPKDCHVRAFVPKASQLWKNLTSACAESDCGYGSPVTSDSSRKRLAPWDDEVDEEKKDLWDLCVDITLALIQESRGDSVVPSLIEPAFLLQKKSNVGLPGFSLIDWQKNRQLALPISPHVCAQALRADRAYLLVGLTRDLGQSLCRLFVEQGARHIVVASRQPNPDAAWIAELNGHGVKVIVGVIDIVDLESVKMFKTWLGEIGAPDLGGIINGAMVLEDGVFANMEIDSWNRVMGPKVTGSQNLVTVFGEEKLDFFIFTSSFAAIGGHAGQAAYAAANMYLNGLAVSLHARGRAGSVLNIGVIYGLGLLARENRQSVYDALERDGYPPISERDIHHMVLEAIEAGRPGISPRLPLTDLTTGLSRYAENEPNPQHWHLDPRFGHLVKYSDSIDVVPADGGGAPSLKELVRSTDHVPDIASLLQLALCERMETILQRPKGHVRKDNSITELGVDSLAATELRKWFYTSANVNVAIMKILNASSIEALCDEVAAQIVKARI